MPQVGIYSAYQLGLHNHLNNENGGILHDYSRYGGFRSPYRTGALAVHADNDAEVSSVQGPPYTLLKQFTFNADYYRCSFQIYWEAKNADNATTVNTRFYRNGTAVSGVVNDATNVYSAVTYNYDPAAGSIVEGTLFQIYGQANGDQVFVQNFRIYYDWHVAGFGDPSLGINLLTTSLPLDDTTSIDVTADF